jgi:SAM-dependent methyltransferase
MSQTTEWFEDWFSSPYYDLLYSHRDEEEAAIFLNQLLQRLNLPASAKIWDLACGKGRHSIFLAEKGFEVTGTDLSEPFIHYAKQFSHSGLVFIRQDMRDAPPLQDFDLVLNLFTAFGYFPNSSDDLLVLQQIYAGLKPGGILVLDYLNVQWAIDKMVAEEEQRKGALIIRIQRKIDQNRIVKQIEIIDKGQSHFYQESILGLSESDFQFLFSKANFHVLECWGDYQGSPFDLKTSARMIWFVQKPS